MNHELCFRCKSLSMDNKYSRTYYFHIVICSYWRQFSGELSQFVLKFIIKLKQNIMTQVLPTYIQKPLARMMYYYPFAIRISLTSDIPGWNLLLNQEEGLEHLTPKRPFLCLLVMKSLPLHIHSCHLCQLNSGK